MQGQNEHPWSQAKHDIQYVFDLFFFVKNDAMGAPFMDQDNTA